MKYFSLIFIALLTLTLAPVAQAEECQTLYAGQTIDVGSVCVDNDDDNLTVSYTTTGDWTLSDLHLFVGTSYDDMPVTKNGNPKIGQFPYTASTSGQFYSFVIPLADLGADCDSSLFIAAHAVVSDGITSETAWADGEPIAARGSWATWFSYDITCGNEEDPENCVNVETGFAFGQMTLIDVVGGAKRWGWQLTVNDGDDSSTPIYAAAGNNVIANGDLVGELQYFYSNGTLLADYVAYPGYAWKATHLYADDVMIATTAPGLYGNTQEFVTPQTLVNYVIAIDPADAATIYVVAHAEVCYVE